MKSSIAGTLVLLTLTSAVAVPAHAAAPAGVAPRTSQTTKPTPSPKPATGQFSAGQDVRIDSQRSRQKPSNPQGPETSGIYASNPGGGLLGVKQDGSNAPSTGSYICSGSTCESPGARSTQGTGRARASKPGEASSTTAAYIKFDGIDGEFRDSGANQKSSELDQSTPILNNRQPAPPATSVGK